MKRTGRSLLVPGGVLLLVLGLALVLSPPRSLAGAIRLNDVAPQRGAQAAATKPAPSQPSAGDAVARAGATPSSRTGHRAGGAQALSRVRVGEDGRWRSYVLDPPPGYVYPKGVAVRTNLPGGTVANPDALGAADGSAATIHSVGAGSPAVILDLGAMVGGQVQIGITQSDGTPVRLAYSEALRFLGPQGDLNYPPQGRNTYPAARYDIVPSSPGVHTIPGVRASERYVWLQLEGAGTVSIDFVRVAPNYLRATPRDYVGHFLSSDEVLNRVWYAGAYTVNLDTIRDPLRGNQLAIADGAKRDRLVWLGDLDMEGLTGSYTVRQLPSIFRRSVQMFTCQQYRDGYVVMTSDVNVNCPRPGPPRGPHGSALGGCSCKFSPRLPEYTAWFMIDAADLYEMSGDSRIARWLPVLERAAGFFRRHRARDGLFVTAPGQINWHPPDQAAGEDAHTNAVWVLALRDLSRLERQIGTARLGGKYSRWARALGRALQARLFDRGAGAFLLNTQDPIRNHPQDANVEAVISGVLSGRAAGGALAFVQNHLWGPYGPATGEVNNDQYLGRYISPWTTGWELVARLRGHDTADALDLIRRLWGHMVNNDPNFTVWEKLTVDGGVAPYQGANPDGSPIKEITPNTPASSADTSLAHGWSSGPTMALSAYVLGLRPVAPGWQTWTVEPQTGDLSYAQGQVKTPRGVLASRWEFGPGRRSFRLTVIAPHRTSGTVAVPILEAPRSVTIARNGRIVWAHGHARGGSRAHASGFYVRFPQGPGAATYAWVR